MSKGGVSYFDALIRIGTKASLSAIGGRFKCYLLTLFDFGYVIGLDDFALGGGWAS